MSEWISLPVEGANLKALVFRGSPKDGEMLIETFENPPMTISTRRVEVTFGPSAGFTVSLRALDDVNFEHPMTWPASHRALLINAAVRWWLADSEWRERLASFSGRQRWRVSEVVDLRLRVN